MILQVLKKTSLKKEDGARRLLPGHDLTLVSFQVSGMCFQPALLTPKPSSFEPRGELFNRLYACCQPANITTFF